MKKRIIFFIQTWFVTANLSPSSWVYRSIMASTSRAFCKDEKTHIQIQTMISPQK